MLTKIVKALDDFNQNGIAVISSDEEHDMVEITEYVFPVLKGLKCSFEVQYSNNDHTCTIIDRMFEN